jgi:hypothetical protein
MAVNVPKILKGFYDRARSLGAKAISSDFALEIEGFEDMWLLAKQAPWPTLSPAGEIEVPGPLGTASWQAQQLKNNQQGQITLHETVAGNVNDMLLNILARGGHFNAKIYEGTPQRYLRAKRIQDCFLVLDNPDRDWENRAQVLTFSGTLFFHYFADDLPGNSQTY